jgi:NADH:ubiquinone oxidoreductase subunit 2 (subunit N)
MTLATILALAAEESEHTGNVALETVGFGITALVVFGALALVTFSYRNVANRHSHKAEAYARAHADDVQQAGHGH